MARTESTALTITPRQAAGSREARRLRHRGEIPGVLYGGGQEPVSFQVAARTLRQALARGSAVLDITVEGGSPSPAVLKELVRHPVSGATLHVDLLRVRLDQKIQSTVIMELSGAEDAPGVRDGGVLEHVTRELTVEALPNDVPHAVTHDVSEMQIGDTVTLEAVRPPAGVVLLDDPETVVATLTPPRLQVEPTEEIEEETAVVGEGEAPAEEAGASEGEGGGEAAASDSESE
jgi:large subunit ribosomal protein L25